jgi:hypothetical protein
VTASKPSAACAAPHAISIAATTMKTLAVMKLPPGLFSRETSSANPAQATSFDGRISDTDDGAGFRCRGGNCLPTAILHL